MILKDLFKLNIENKEKYHFCIFIDENFDVINTFNKMTFNDLIGITGLSISCMKVVSFKIYKDNIIHIKLKDS